jgi:hypothetical protein
MSQTMERNAIYREVAVDSLQRSRKEMETESW